jgi:hypothetical protein
MTLVGTRTRVCLMTAVGILAAASVWAAEPAGGTGVGKDMRILYVSHAGSAREKDFVDFLSQHFGTVSKGDWATFAESQCAGFDVTILDYDYDGDSALSMSGPRLPRLNLSREFSHPVITVGYAGAITAKSLKLKTGYM